MTLRTTSAEIARNFGKYRAGTEPVEITHHGRLSHILLPVADYERRCSDTRSTTVRDAESFETLVGLMEFGLLICDRVGQVLYVNATLAAMTRRELKDIAGRYLLDAFPELLGSVAEVSLRRVVTSGEPVQFDMQSVMRRGRWINVRAVGFEGGSAIVVRDITETVADMRLADLKKAMIEAMDLHGGVAYVRISIRGGIEHVSGSFATMIGLPRERLIGTALADLVPMRQRAAVRECIEKALQQCGRGVVDTAFLSNDGSAWPTRLSMTGLSGAYGCEGAVVIVAPLASAGAA